MKRKFAVLTVLGALVALAVPASSMAFMYPAGQAWEISGGTTPPTLGNSLGSCPVTKIAGTIPSAPANEGEIFPVTVNWGTCSSGTTISVVGAYNLTTTSGFNTSLAGGTVTMRFSSLPGCKLSGNPPLFGLWLNGIGVPKQLKSAYHAHGAAKLTWSDDGATCALSGTTEKMTWGQEPLPYSAPGYTTVTNLTNPNTFIWAGR